MNKTTIVAAAAALLLVGCGASEGEPGSVVTVTETVTVTATPEVVEGEPMEEPADEDLQGEPAAAAGMLAFGDRVELDGAVAVTIGQPEPVELDPELWDFDASFDTFLAVPVIHREHRRRAGRHIGFDGADADG